MKMDLSFTVTSIVFLAMGICILAVGLWGLAAKRPFLIPARWLFVVMVAAFSPLLIRTFFYSFRGFTFMDWIPLLMFGGLLLMFWYQTRGYMAFGVTDTSFREALLAVLGKLQLPHEESLSSIRLTSVEADLQVVVQSWVGTGQIRAKQGRRHPLLKEIAHAMNEYFRTASLRPNMIFYAYFVFIGVLVVMVAIRMLFF